MVRETHEFGAEKNFTEISERVSSNLEELCGESESLRIAIKSRRMETKNHEEIKNWPPSKLLLTH